MKKILQENRRYILRFDLGEDVIEKLKNFCGDEKIGSGFISGIGTTSEVILGLYDLKNKKYIDNSIVKNMEIASFSGNISVFEDEPVIHAHGVFSDENNVCLGGHVKKMITGATCEVFMIRLDQEIERAKSEKIGINLME